MLRLFCFVLFGVTSINVYALPSITFSDIDIQASKRILLFINDPNTLTGAAKQVDDATNGRFSQALADSDFKARLGSRHTFYGLSPYSHLVVVGTGAKSADAALLQDLGGYAASELPAVASPAANIIVDGITTDVEHAAAYIALGAALRDYHFDKYKNASSQTEPRTLIVQGKGYKASQSLFESDLSHLAEGVYLARDMAWEPGNGIYPQEFVERIERAFRGVRKVDIDVMKVRDMQKLNMGALLGVGRGSIHDPRLIIIEYKGADKDQAPIALVGKGITFDTGGISLKNNDGMWTMKSDLSGAAAVAGTMLAIAKRQEKVNLVGLMALAENMPAEDAIRPGDVLRTMQGTTIEIISTDAEGRLVLADAVRYAQYKFKPKMLLNIATLTGSASRATSDEYAAVITRDFELSAKMMEIGKTSGELVWPLPLHPNHFNQISSDIADIRNSGAGRPGASIGAAVVGTFIDKDLPWVHLDIAGVDWLNAPIAVAPAGAQGWGVRFMDQLVRENR